MIEIKQLSHSFNGKKVLNNINLEITEKKVAIIGANGSGKSTFVRMLNGLIAPDNGSVTIDKINVKKNTAKIRKKVGFVFQNPDNQIVFPTIEEDVAFGLKNLKLPLEQIEKKVSDILSRYDIEHLRNHSCHLLSGGEKQMLAIASVLVMDPEYIIFDEPTTQLDLRNKIKISNTIMNLKQHIIVISHDMEQIENFNRIIMFDKGKIDNDGKPSEIIPYYTQKMKSAI
ncbi:MAG: ATP-binding cassette domain-containing protein [Alphaproteobacteria bacterium]|nr:ATP-binding cassette domain-containing protein [Alphaproteobacteria bacterium]